MSRSGLFRAAALLVAGVAPLLAGPANAVEVPQHNGGVPEVGADEPMPAATQNRLEPASTVNLGEIKAPVAGDVQAAETAKSAKPAKVPNAQERTVPAPLPEHGTLPGLPNAEALTRDANVDRLKAPSLSDLPANGVVPNPASLPGTLPKINR